MSLLWQFICELAGFWGLSLLFGLAAYGAFCLYQAFVQAPLWNNRNRSSRIEW